MKREEFGPACSGKLVQTTAWEAYTDKGHEARRQAKGVAFVPDPLPPALDLRDLLPRIDELHRTCERALGRLDALAEDVAVARVLAAPIMRREASVSSRIENTIATPEQVALYEAGDETKRRDTIEVANYRRALEQGLRSDLPLTMRLVREMHSILMEGVRGDGNRPGEIRDLQNQIGGDHGSFASARFVPPPPGEPLNKLLRNLEEFWNGKHTGKLPPLVRLAIGHYQFEAIHPFEDGNGRLGRLLIVLTMIRQQIIPAPLVYVSGFFDRNREQYFDLLLRVSTHGVWVEWIEFFLRGVAAQIAESVDRLSAIKRERERVHRALASENAPARCLDLVDRLISTLAIDARSASEVLGVSNPTARGYLARLERIGFAREATGRSYGKIWVASSMLDLISDTPRTAPS